MSWTNVSKPNSTSYTNVNARGKEQYDQATILYDDPDIVFDGFNNHIWTRVSKPTNTNIVITGAGMTMGLLIPLTRSVNQNIVVDDWTRVAKPV